MNMVKPQIILGCVPYGLLNEFKAQFHLAWPLSLSMLFVYLVQPMSIAFCGHLGKTELASVAMAISVLYLLLVSIGRGLAFGGDTFFSQTYGSENKKTMGIYLQKGIIFCMLWSMPIIGILLNTETILLLLKQDQDVARLTQEYVTLFMPGVLPYCCLFMIMRYLLCQNKVIPILLISFFSCGINGVFNYLLVYQANMGIKGSAITLALTYFLTFILQIIYIWRSQIYKETWGGWSFKCLEDWWDFFCATFNSICLTLCLWIYAEIGTFLGGIISPVALSVHSICFQVEGIAWIRMFPRKVSPKKKRSFQNIRPTFCRLALGIGGACTSRVGQFLGAKNPRDAINSARVAIGTIVVLSIIMAALCFGLRYYIPLVFTTELDVVEYTAMVLQATGVYVLFEGFSGVCISIVRGTGRHTDGVIIALVSYFIIGLPIGIPLMFLTNLGLYGLWWGMVIGLFMMNIFFTISIFRVSWDEEAEKARRRSEVGLGIAYRSEQHQEEISNHDIKCINQSREEDIPKTALKIKVIMTKLVVVLVFALPLITGIMTRMFVQVVITDSTTMCSNSTNFNMSHGIHC